MTAITGNTFPVRAKLAQLGGTWNKVAKCWMVPDDKAEEARRIVATPAATAATAAGHAHYAKVGDGWGVCCPESMPTEQRMPGAVVSVMTKSGKVNQECLGAFVKRTERGFVFTVAARVKVLKAASPMGNQSGEVRMRDPGEDTADRWMEGGGVA